MSACPQDLRLSLSAHRTKKLLALALVTLNYLGVALCAAILIVQLITGAAS